jgi:hypothetical protein
MEKAWARDLGGRAHTNEAKLYCLRFRRRLRGDCFQGNSPRSDNHSGSCLAATERNFGATSAGEMAAARGIIVGEHSGHKSGQALETNGEKHQYRDCR